MPTVVQFRRGTTSQNNSFTGAEGEFSVDTSLNTIRVHDGLTEGGFELLRKDSSNLVETVTSVGTSPTAIATFPASVYRGGKYIITIKDVVNTEYQTCELNVIHNGSAVKITSYGLVYTSDSACMSFTASVSGDTVTIYGTGTSANNTVKLIKFLLPV